MNRSLTSRAFAAIASSTALLWVAPTAAATQPAPAGVLAEFEGRTIDLAKGWGEAHACSISAQRATCYRTEAEMDAALGHNRRSGMAPFASCSTSLRLYDGASYGGDVLELWTRAVLITLSTHGFDNRTSSYKVGACAANLYDGIQTGLYPGNTGANVQSPSMLSGWNNTISSVKIP